jgi:hypothetical protein
MRYKGRYTEDRMSDAWENADLVTRLRSYPAVPPGIDAFDVRTACDLMEAAAKRIEELEAERDPPSAPTDV